jgi:signal transduction histidine kinase
VVEVSGAGDAGTFYIFCVADNGVGIAPERRKVVFRLFAKGADGGTGVGLAIVDRVVSHHGGRVWIEGEPGKGSRFFFTIPKPEGAA